jgi:Bacterial archaeo-eukaryotic release factor family 10
MRVPTESDLRRLLAWRADAGVISVYVDLRPEDRGEAWRIELRNALGELAEAAGGDRNPVAATAERIRARVEAEARDPSGRTMIAFVEVAPKRGREEWFALQAPRERTEASLDRRPRLRPLVALLDGGGPWGVAAVSAERVRLLLWTLGTTDEIGDWGLEIFSLDWRERKAKRSADPARVQGAKASGRDQFDQRLEHNRERFLSEAGRLVATQLAERGCRELIVFGDREHAVAFADAAGQDVAVNAVESQNVIREPTGAIAARAAKLIADLRRRRALELVERAKQEGQGGTRGALGVEETLQALAEARVAHLLVDARGGLDVDRAEVEAALAAVGGDDGAADGELAERMVELALDTSARVTPVEGEAAESLAEVGGAAALLRY